MKLSGARLTEVNGYKMYLNPEDEVVSRCLEDTGIWEPLETRIALHEVGLGDVVLDIGANIGYYTLLFGKLVGAAGQVVAFEPEPKNVRFLKANVELNGCANVTIVPAAVAARSGKIPLYLASGNPGDHRLFGTRLGRRTVQVDAVVLDEYPKLTRVDFIKMDIQGAEGLALQGMRGLIQRNPALKLMTEFWPGGLRASGVQPSEYLQVLESLGFRLHLVDDSDPAGVGARDNETLLQKYARDEESFATLFCTLSEWQPSYDLATTAAKLHDVRESIRRVMPPRAVFALIDDYAWEDGLLVEDREGVRFTEDDEPESDDEAIERVVKLQAEGATYLVVSWPAQWWLEHFARFGAYVRDRFKCAFENERVSIFELRAPAAPEDLRQDGRGTW